MKNRIRNFIGELKHFLILWSTQSLSQLGSSMTAYALTLWLYEETGSALQTALLAISTYVPYVIMSIFAGALSDRWNKKKTMLVCDTMAAVCTVLVLFMLKLEILMPWHLYVLNAVNGLMNTVQQPASDVAMTLIIPKKHYQRTCGLRSFSQSVTTIFSPILATAIFSLLSIYAVIVVDLCSFLIAFGTLLFFVDIPEIKLSGSEKKESLLKSAKGGLVFLKNHSLILILILFLAGVNFVASAFDATLAPLVLSRTNGDEMVLGAVSASAGIATLIGSIVATMLPKPKNRVRVIYLTMLFSLGIENFMLAFTDSPIWWCIAQLIGWSVVPVMSANLDVILRSSIPVEMQGRVYSCRNTLQFFTIPIGLFMGGFLIDHIFEPFMKNVSKDGILCMLFGTGKGAGAAVVMFLLGVMGITVCLLFGRRLEKYKYND